MVESRHSYCKENWCSFWPTVYVRPRHCGCVLANNPESVNFSIERRILNWHEITDVKPCPHCRREVRLSQKMATVAENGEKTATVALFCDSVDRA